jgi:hypothetical protein
MDQFPVEELVLAAYTSILLDSLCHYWESAMSSVSPMHLTELCQSTDWEVPVKVLKAHLALQLQVSRSSTITINYCDG